MRHRKRPAKSRSRRGAAVVEFAITVPVLFLIVFGIVEFGRMLMVKNALSNAAREGCRQAVLATTQDRHQVDAAVARYLNAVVPTADVRVNVSRHDLSAVASGTQVIVDVSVPYADVSWLPVDAIVGDSVLRATAIQRRE